MKARKAKKIANKNKKKKVDEGIVIDKNLNSLEKISKLCEAFGCEANVAYDASINSYKVTFYIA